MRTLWFLASIVLGCHRPPPIDPTTGPQEPATTNPTPDGAANAPEVETSPAPGAGGTGTQCTPGKLTATGDCACPDGYVAVGGPGSEDWGCWVLHTHPEHPELSFVELETGKGPVVKPGDEIQVRYVGRLEDGTVFDEATSPTSLTVGKGVLIKGWDYGVPGMRVGGRRRLFVPASLGYGEKGAPPKIPPFSALIFTIEVVSVSP